MKTVRKHSKKRDAILQCVRQTDTHPSAEWVYSQLKPVIPDLSLGTVYRNLSLFKTRGEIISVGTVRGLERFDGCVAPHAHFICSQCGCVVDLPGIAPSQSLSRQARAQTGFQVDECLLTFTGLCKNCKEESA